MRPTKQALTITYIASVVLLITLLSSTPLLAAPSRSAKQTQLKKKQSSLQYQIRKKRQLIREVKAKEHRTKVQLRDTEHRQRVWRGQLIVAKTQLERKKVELHRANKALVGAKSEYTSAQGEVGEHLVAMYQRGPQGYLDILLSSEDFGDMLQRAQLAEFMAEQDQGMLDTLKEREMRVAEYRKHVAEKTQEVAAWKQRVAVLHNRTDLERRRVSDKLEDTQDNREALMAELAALERDSASVTNMLRSLSRSSGGKKRYNRVYTGSVGGLPVNGRITSGFGYRMHPVLGYRRLHTGLDIAAPTGTPIHAAGGGEVVFAGRRGGYGNCVIIDHGRSKATLYGHMSSLGVRSGQVVSRGQTIGRVGSTGMSTGPHLHYEVRINGSPVNPR